MDTLGQILGTIGMVAGILLLAGIIAVIVFVAWIRRQLKALSGLAAAPGTPSRIHLREAPDAPWTDKPSLEAKLEKALNLGLIDIGSFTIEEMPGVLMHGLARLADGLVCVIYEHPKAGQWLDFVTLYADGSSITVSSAKTGHELEHRPNHDKIYLSGDSAESLYGTMMSRRPAREYRQFDETAAGFMALFENAYKEEMDWRNARGGPSEAEIRRIAGTAGIEVTDETVQFQRMISERQSCEGLAVALEERFREQHDMPESDWKEYARRLVFVHDKMNGDMVRNCLLEAAGDDFFSGNDNTTVLESMPAREAFLALNARLSEEARFRKVGELSEPIRADVYQSTQDEGPAGSNSSIGLPSGSSS